MKQAMPVNPGVLRWARTSINLTLDEVASHFRKKVAAVEKWERGEDYPTYIQLEKLARLYKRPLAILFFPEPPKEDTIDSSLRTLPQHVQERIPPHVCWLLRKAKVLQMNLSELYRSGNTSDRRILDDLDYSLSAKASEMAATVRDYLGIDIAKQKSWRNSEDALKHWRDVLERAGIFVFKDSFKSKRKHTDAKAIPFSGFCLYDKDYPIIYVNNNEANTSQIHTLFHELAHLLMKTGGIDTRQRNFEDLFSGTGKRIEVLCNQFAAALLVPIDNLQEDLSTLPDKTGFDDKAISKLAESYGVSREMIMRRFVDLGLIEQSYYEQKAQQWNNEWLERASRQTVGGGNYYSTLGTYLGERYITTVYTHYLQDRITAEEVADYLGEKRIKSVSIMEDWLHKQRART